MERNRFKPNFTRKDIVILRLGLYGAYISLMAAFIGCMGFNGNNAADRQFREQSFSEDQDQVVGVADPLINAPLESLLEADISPTLQTSDYLSTESMNVSEDFEKQVEIIMQEYATLKLGLKQIFQDQKNLFATFDVIMSTEENKLGAEKKKREAANPAGKRDLGAYIAWKTKFKASLSEFVVELCRFINKNFQCIYELECLNKSLWEKFDALDAVKKSEKEEFCKTTSNRILKLKTKVSNFDAQLRDFKKKYKREIFVFIDEVKDKFF